MDKQEHNEKTHFDHIASNYDTNYGYDKPYTNYKIDQKAYSFKECVSNYYKDKTITILEIGCGTGEYTGRIGKLLPKSKIIGIDISSNVLKIAQRKMKIQNVIFKNASAYNIPLRNNSVDVVCAFYALHHLNSKKVLKEFSRVLKPGGVLYFYEPNILNPLVWLIKTIKPLKALIGDSPDEWGVNPLKIKTIYKDYSVMKMKFSGFVIPLYFIPPEFMKQLDRIFGITSIIPLFKFVGGSIEVCLIKEK